MYILYIYIYRRDAAKFHFSTLYYIYVHNVYTAYKGVHVLSTFQPPSATWDDIRDESRERSRLEQSSPVTVDANTLVAGPNNSSCDVRFNINYTYMIYI